MKFPPVRIAAVLVFLLASGVGAFAQGYGGDDDGFFVFLDAAFLTPGNTDQVVAESQNLNSTLQTATRLEVDWDAGTAGALGFGWRWGQNAVSVRYWRFDNDESFVADGTSGSTTNFAIGPASYYFFPSYGYYVPVYYFGLPGHFDFVSNLEATTIDATFSQSFEAGDYFDLEWSVGLRFATFDEDLTGLYDLCASTGCDAPYSSSVVPGEITFDVAKTNESDMLGVVAALSGRYYFADWGALAGGVGTSVLGGEITSRSGLTPSGTFNGADTPTLASRVDDSRTGMIHDAWFGLDWVFLDERLRLHTGLWYSSWDGVAKDLVRNTPGLDVRNAPRDQVSFSGARVTAGFQF